MVQAAGAGGSVPVPAPGRPLDGAHALVTGGHVGLGRAVVAALARAGADVAVTYPDDRPEAHDAARAAEDHVTRAGRAGLLLPADLTDPDRCRQVVADTVEHLGGLEVLVHALTGESAAAHLDDVRPAPWRRTWALLVDSVVHLTQAALPRLEGGGRVVVTAEAPGSGTHSPPLDVAGAGGALVAMSRSLARSLGARGVRVSCVVPVDGAADADVAAWYVRLASPSDEPASADVVLAGRGVPL
jgi:NAD(P)-dependent dehydrogenase (short-subunit alcohol dehydrogenase family)